MSKKIILTSKILREGKFKVLTNDRKVTHSCNGFKYPKVGCWTKPIEKLEMCQRGYHVCRIEDLCFWINKNNNRIYLVKTKGNSIYGLGKEVWESIKLVKLLPWGESDYEDLKKFCCIKALGFTYNYFPINYQLYVNWIVRRIMRNYRKNLDQKD